MSLGGDTDTIAAIAGAMAEAFFGISYELEKECRERVPKDMRSVLWTFVENSEKELCAVDKDGFIVEDGFFSLMR